ncbi:MAG: hypothetical protein R3245_03335 [Kiloniellales bacterium]|nr:hypothetical protein [Kiloniellales bacterium]
MIRRLVVVYHVSIAFIAILLLLSILAGMIFFLTEGVLGYFFGIDLLGWIKAKTGLDIRVVIGFELAGVSLTLK